MRSARGVIVWGIMLIWMAMVKLTCVTWREFGSQQSVTARTLHSTLLLKIPLWPPMAEPSGWGGGRTKSPLVAPLCAIWKGQGTVHFPPAGGNKWNKYLIDHSFLFSSLGYSRCIQSGISRATYSLWAEGMLGQSTPSVQHTAQTRSEFCPHCATRPGRYQLKGCYVKKKKFWCDHPRREIKQHLVGFSWWVKSLNSQSS